ncbi:MAG: hypothetical protein ACO1OT_13685 [Heyndrickxia sp.]
MEVYMGTLSIAEIKNQLSQWNYFLLHQEKESATKIKEAVDQYFLEADGKLPKLEYLLVSCRHKLLVNKDFDNANNYINDIEGFKSQFNTFHEFYLYDLKGLYYYGLKQYDRALESYQMACDMADEIDDVEERAEVYYKTGAALFYLDYLTPSIEIVERALAIFSEKGNIKRCADCHVLLAQNYRDKNLFELAISNLQEAQSLYKGIGTVENFNIISQVLGIIYLKQDRRVDAIEAFKNGLEDNNNIELKIPLLYRLSKEYFLVNDFPNAKKYLSKGIELCRTNTIEEYIHHFNILEAKFLLHESYKGRLVAGVNYLYKKGIWGYVGEYSRELADLLFSEGDYKESAKYYRLASEARNNDSLKGK